MVVTKSISLIIKRQLLPYRSLPKHLSGSVQNQPYNPRSYPKVGSRIVLTSMIIGTIWDASEARREGSSALKIDLPFTYSKVPFHYENDQGMLTSKLCESTTMLLACVENEYAMR